MASLEHFSSEGRDCYRIRFQIGKKRYSVGLGMLDEADSILAKEHIEHLVDRHVSQRPPHPKTMHWIDTLPAEIHDKLSAIGLVEPRRLVDMPRTLLAFMTAYVDQRTDWKKPENYRQAIHHLRTFLKKDVSISGLNVADVERWLGWMTNDKKGPQLSPNTAGQHVKRCPHMMRQAIKEKLTTENPFSDVKIDLRSDSSKDYEVTTADAQAILEACPDQEWRTLFALNRFGGLRCPSEVLRVKWSDIAWDRGRLKVSSPKTARYGKGERIVPLFPELRAELKALQEVYGEGESGDPKSPYVIRRYRHSETNLRTAFGRILDRAGIIRFAKPFMNCRTTRRNELERQGSAMRL